MGPTRNFIPKAKSLLSKVSLPVLFTITLFFFVTVFSGSRPATAMQGDMPKVSAPTIPEKADFCGEPVPMENFEVLERFDTEIIANAYSHTNSIRYLKRAGRWFPVIEPILKKNNIPDDFKYLCIVESGMANLISPAQATGFWQFLASSGAEFGLEINAEVDERYHVEKSTEAACKYLRAAHNRYNNWTLAAASYNMGVGGISNSLAQQKVNNYYDLFLNEETSRYILRIVAVKEFFQNPKKYGYFIEDKELYSPLETKTVDVNTGIPNFVDYAKANNTTLRIFKTLNPWLRAEKLTNAARRTYSIRLPK